jgi:spermidine synthase
LSLAQIGFSNAIQLLSTFAGQARDLKGWLQDAELTRDSNLRLQYLAGLGLNLRHGDYIYRNMVAYRQSPDDMFTGSQELKTALWEFMRYQ